MFEYQDQISMALIFESEHFLVEAPEKPLIDRFDGGHVTITPKKKVASIQDFTPRQSVELMWLTTVTGQAMAEALNANGVNVGRINYQDNGNWSVDSPEGPWQHMHLYGRARNAKVQKFGQACYFPHRDEHPEFYSSLRPLTPEDVRAIRSRIEKLISTQKYSVENWKLNHVN